jgi:hypothetical protein
MTTVVVIAHIPINGLCLSNPPGRAVPCPALPCPMRHSLIDRWVYE